jgi:hypothetical protein
MKCFDFDPLALFFLLCAVALIVLASIQCNRQSHIQTCIDRGNRPEACAQGFKPCL